MHAHTWHFLIQARHDRRGVSGTLMPDISQSDWVMTGRGVRGVTLMSAWAHRGMGALGATHPVRHNPACEAERFLEIAQCGWVLAAPHTARLRACVDLVVPAPALRIMRNPPHRRSHRMQSLDSRRKVCICRVASGGDLTST
jgi:hypothetical protein